MHTLKKTLELFSHQEKLRGLLVLMMVIGMATLEAVGVASVMPFLAVLGNPDMVQTNAMLSTLYRVLEPWGIRSTDQFLMILGAGAFALILLSAAYRTLTHYVLNRFIEMRRHSIETRLMETYLRQPYTFFLNRHSSDMSKTVLSEVDQMVGGVVRPAITMLSYIVVLSAILLLLLFANPLLALVVAAIFTLIYSLLYTSIRSYLSRLGQRRMEANKERFMAASEAFGAIKAVKILGCEQAYLHRFRGPSWRFARTLASNLTLNQIPHYLVEAIIFGGILLLTLSLFLYHGGSNSSALGQILPILGLYAFAIYRIKPAAQNVYQGITSLRYGAAAVDNIHRDLQERRHLAQLHEEAPSPLRIQQGITLNNISYTYPQAQQPTVQDIQLYIPVGSTVGLVGSTGAGKTTLVDLILGLLHPCTGELLLDGQAVQRENVRAWQQSLGYVPQEIFLSDTSVAENIALGIPKDRIDQQQVQGCAEMAQIHDFIMQDLPQGYATLVGERGVRLSGGQRQRLGIARALYHNPEVLVFDEATSALDTVTEQAVMQAIEGLRQQKTIILIAHRLSTIRICDRIVLLEKGRIRAQGSFAQLQESDEQFQRMINFPGSGNSAGA